MRIPSRIPVILLAICVLSGNRFTFSASLMQGPQVITALSEGRGYGDAGGEGLFSSHRISESLAHPACGIPPHPQAGEGCCQLMFRRQTKMNKLRGGAERPCRF